MGPDANSTNCGSVDIQRETPVFMPCKGSRLEEVLDDPHSNYFVFIGSIDNRTAASRVEIRDGSRDIRRTAA